MTAGSYKSFGVRLAKAKQVFELRSIQGKSLRAVAAELGIHKTEVCRRDEEYREAAFVMGIPVPPRVKYVREAKQPIQAMGN